MDAKKIAAIVATFVIGFGAGAATVGPISEPAPLKPKVVVKEAPNSIPKSKIGVAPESARTPEGACQLPPYGTCEVERTFGGPLTAAPIHIDAKGLRFIENFEEVQKSIYCPYWDAYGRVWTRGFGETDWSGNFGGRCITNAQATANLKNQIEGSYQWAVRGLGVSFSQNQIDALDSFVWNLGAGIFTGSLRYDIQHYNPYPLLAYDRAGGQVLAGLATRRRAEVNLFLTPGPRPVEETHAQKVARWHRELKAHEGLLKGYEKRHAVLHRELQAKGCTARRHNHQKLGPKCQRWFREGDETGAKARHELRIIHAFHHKGIF